MAAITTPDQLPWFVLERSREPFQIIDRYVPQATLDAADVRTVDLTEVRERVLAEAVLCPKSSQVDREDLSEAAWMSPFHPPIERRCRR